jgi:hypothetical protein
MMENIGVYRYIQQLISYITVFSVIVGRSRNTPRKSSPERIQGCGAYKY